MPDSPASSANRILVRMRDRLFAGLLTGPNLNCRPHSSRQRVDWSQLERFRDVLPEAALRELLQQRRVRVTARVIPPPTAKQASSAHSKIDVASPADAERSVVDTAAADASKPQSPPTSPVTPIEKAPPSPWTQQQAVISKLRHIAEDARTYEQDTGVHVLNVGFPLLSLPTVSGSRSGWGARRVLAPIAFVPVRLTIRAGATASVDIACEGHGIDTVVPNAALLAWLQQQHGKIPQDLFADEEGTDPWGEIATLVRLVAGTVGIGTPESFREGAPAFKDSTEPLIPVPKADEDALSTPRVLLSAVLGLFPMNNQGLLRDTIEMIDEPHADPLRSFLSVHVETSEPDDAPADEIKPASPAPEHAPEPVTRTPASSPTGRQMQNERFIAPLDPCQAKAVRMARECPALVIHGPPGTGKSQTITNIIGDHLARGERVLMVCDKRTALDVVANRLEHLGLGDLTAVIHDPQLDQRDLYRAVREQLEQLADKPPVAGVESSGSGIYYASTHSVETSAPQPSSPPVSQALAKLDGQLQLVHRELTDAWTAVMRPEGEQPAFHELAGHWLDLGGPADEALVSAERCPSLAELKASEPAIRELFDRVEEIDYPRHPWRGACRMTQVDFLSGPAEPMRRTLRAFLELALAVDETCRPDVPPFDTELPLGQQGRSRLAVAMDLEWLGEKLDPALLSAGAKVPLPQVSHLAAQVRQIAPLTGPLLAPLDAELQTNLNAGSPGSSTISQQLTSLQEWLLVAERWYALVFFKRRQAAAAVLTSYGLPGTVEAAKRLSTFLEAARARRTRQAHLDQILAELSCPRPANSPAVLSDAQQELLVDGLTRLFRLRLRDRRELGEAEVASPPGTVITIEDALQDSARRLALINRGKHSEVRARALVGLREKLEASKLLDADWIIKTIDVGSRGQTVADRLQPLINRFDELDDVIRITSQYGDLPDVMLPLVGVVLGTDGDPVKFDASHSWTAIERTVLFHELARRIRSSKILQQIDSTGMAKALERYRALEAQKQELVRESILQLWLARQQSRLLVGTGSRLNGAGADLRRRLTLRGERAMRLRQVIAAGEATDGGDPLFDLRPLWMASPETVAQIFPRKAMFDVVIFDEASQCRLEEALPVLTRAKRVVVAGDPKQLPPTRFFETTLAASGDENEPETEQELFEAHQGDVEDLLDGALGLSIAQCYLDVHYRSRNSDLIAFSNAQFYDARLQPIPGHPSRTADHAPIVLHQVDGTYHERQNPAEADQIVKLVRELLARDKPPSIGIACFNLTQRDLIVEKLDELATVDKEFGERLALARERRGEATFEGLFVKNLENVQGDERDQILISTTYGPDPQGRFYRRFGPLGREGGGRRLNVLVTRARDEVHLVTSIPRHASANLPPVPPGQSPGGGWLLFAYLEFARRMRDLYENPDDEPVTVSTVKNPSPFATALGHWLWQKHGRRSDLHYGNDGFCVDVAVRDGLVPDVISHGVLCDGTRYTGSDDPAAWDAFRTAILEATGWTLQRLWTPAFFRDPQRVTAKVLKAAGFRSPG